MRLSAQADTARQSPRRSDDTSCGQPRTAAVMPGGSSGATSECPVFPGGIRVAGGSVAPRLFDLKEQADSLFPRRSPPSARSEILRTTAHCAELILPGLRSDVVSDAGINEFQETLVELEVVDVAEAPTLDQPIDRLKAARRLHRSSSAGFEGRVASDRRTQDCRECQTSSHFLEIRSGGRGKTPGQPDLD
jgi:hypothetical protein